MRVPRSVFILRLACVSALVAGALLTADALRPDRSFCPLAAACDRAKSSALGNILGIPTSTIGLVAFGGLLAITLLPLRLARRLARPAAIVGAVAGFIFVAYQAIFLRAFCPFCLVADISALIAGAAAIAWEPPYLYRGNRKPPTESITARIRWALAGQLAIAVPLLWPAPPAAPSWTALPQGSIDVAAAFADADRVAAPAATPAAEPSEPSEPTEPAEHDAAATPTQDSGELPFSPAGGVFEARPIDGADDSTSARDPKRTAAGAKRPGASRSTTSRPATTYATRAPASLPQRREVMIVEYLNPFCSHCRATHARLDRILLSFGPVRRHRVYAWPGGGEPPLWAIALAVAQKQGREQAMFDALVASSGQDPGSVRATAQQVGIEPWMLQAAYSDPQTLSWLDRNRSLIAQTRIEGLPTFDIGRRRLMGEQSFGELQAALSAALVE